MTEVRHIFSTYQEIISNADCFIIDSSNIELKNCIIDFEFHLDELLLELPQNNKIFKIPKENTDEKEDRFGEIISVKYNLSISEIVFNYAFICSGIGFHGKTSFRDIKCPSIAFTVTFFTCDFFELQSETLMDHEFDIIDVDNVCFSHCYFNSSTMFLNYIIKEKFTIENSSIDNFLAICNLKIFDKERKYIPQDVNSPSSVLQIISTKINGELSIGEIILIEKLIIQRVNVNKDTILKIKGFNKQLSTSVKNFGEIELAASMINGTVILDEIHARRLLFNDICLLGNIIESKLFYSHPLDTYTSTTLKNQSKKHDSITLYNKHRAEELESEFINSVKSPFNYVINVLSRDNEIKYSLGSKIRNCIGAIWHFIWVFVLSLFLSILFEEKQIKTTLL